ncbi:MAG: hypothetical protein EAZ07_01100 [Cytophagales bacterium]|nr:MAG: hypothetical protein EAZ07_01100 [Cytophagales bacterium]
MATTRHDESNFSKGVIGSIIVHSLLLLLLFFLVINPPNPPLGEVGGSGIELNYGLDAEGYGDIQTMNEANTSPINEDVAPSQEELAEQANSEIIPIEPTPSPIENNILKSDNPDDIKLDEVKKEIKVEAVKVPEKVVEKKVETPAVVAKPVVKPTTQTAENANGKTGTEQKIGGNNNGDRPGKVGDQGNPQGTLDAKALYGNLGEGGEGAGGSGGNRLEMSGWKPLFRIDKKDATNENGKIVFQIKVDNQGDLISIIPIEKTVSPAVVEFYKRQIEENWAVERARENINPPPVSSGKYTVFVKSK